MYINDCRVWTQDYEGCGWICKEKSVSKLGVRVWVVFFLLLSIFGICISWDLSELTCCININKLLCFFYMTDWNFFLSHLHPHPQILSVIKCTDCWYFKNGIPYYMSSFIQDILTVLKIMFRHEYSTTWQLCQQFQATVITPSNIENIINAGFYLHYFSLIWNCKFADHVLSCWDFLCLR